MIKKPEWLKVPRPESGNKTEVEGILKALGLNTVCREAACPNYLDCFSRKTATFMILGTNCTRNCSFCNVSHSAPMTVDPQEPENVAKAVKALGLRYAVITSVTRDDLPDGGAAHFSEVIAQIHRLSPDTAVEVLIPDFLGDLAALKKVADAAPTVISHNMETVKPLYPAVRPQAVYSRSLEVLKNIKLLGPAIRSKTGIMLGLGETHEQVETLFDDLIAIGCEFLTIGQYLAPSAKHLPVTEYVHPEVFDEYADLARRKGFVFVASAPLVRSSYHAADALESK